MTRLGILGEILENKERELEARKKQLPLDGLKKGLNKFQIRNFKEAISTKQRPLNLIAEIKKASPSAGVLREHFNLQAITEIYNRRAQAISVLTDEKYFQGKPEYLQEVRGASSLPILQKDFIIDEYQLYEARAFGADAVLLIAAALAKPRLKKLYSVAKSIGLHCLVEVHSSACVEKALNAKAEVIGINNRDLETMKINLNTTINLRGMLPEGKTIVSESGFSTSADLALVRGKVDAVLIGSAFMKAEDIESKLFELGF